MLHQYIVEKEGSYAGAWLYDFYLPDLNMLVEVDGEYWHSKSKEQINKDKIKTKIASELSYDFCRISDSDFRPELIFESRESRAKNNSNIIKNRLTT